MSLLHLQKMRIARRYATALLQEALTKGKTKIKTIAEQLDRLGEALQRDTKAMETLISNPLLDKSERSKAMQNISKALKLDSLIASTFDVLITHDRLDHLPEVIQAYSEAYDVQSGRRHVRAITAQPMKTADAKALNTTLKKVLACDEIAMEIETDETLLGGMVLQMGSLRIDDSLKGKLQQLKKSI